VNERNSQYRAALFNSVREVMSAESFLKKADIPFKLVPIPKKLSSDCGICIRFAPEDEEKICSELNGVLKIREIVDL
jgi:hypothetical protein